MYVRERCVQRELKALRTNQTTGRDEIPARILRSVRLCVADRCAAFFDES